MIRMDKLLDIVLTEALEEDAKAKLDSGEKRKAEGTNPPSMRYDLELIKTKDGKYIWVE